MKKIIIAIIIIASGAAVWFYKQSAPHSSEREFKDISKYPEVTYTVASGCGGENGALPPATVDADFDGDGKYDKVRLAQADPTHQALVVWLSSKNYAPQVLDTVSFSDGRMAISLAHSGEVIQSACGKGYMDCKEGEPAEIKLKQDAIWYVFCESAASIFYWNPEKSNLDRLWTSD